MLIDKKEIKEKDGSIGYYECIFDSTNILKTTYFPTMNRLYIAFKRGDTYSYENVDAEFYSKFEKDESQGVFFVKNLNKNPKYPARKEFTLYPQEINEAENIIDDKKSESNIDDSLSSTLLVDSNNQYGELLSIDNSSLIYNQDTVIHNVYEDSIVLSLDGEEYIKVSKKGFYWKGKLIENDYEIYEKFKEFLNKNI